MGASEHLGASWPRGTPARGALRYPPPPQRPSPRPPAAPARPSQSSPAPEPLSTLRTSPRTTSSAAAMSPPSSRSPTADRGAIRTRKAGRARVHREEPSAHACRRTYSRKPRHAGRPALLKAGRPRHVTALGHALRAGGVATLLGNGGGAFICPESVDN